MQEEYSNLKSLLEHPGWKMVENYADGQIENRMPSALGKLENILEVTGQEFEKGEIAGITLFKRIPELVVADLEENIAGLEEELEYDDGEHTRDDRHVGTDDDRGAADDAGGLFEPPV